MGERRYGHGGWSRHVVPQLGGCLVLALSAVIVTAAPAAALPASAPTITSLVAGPNPAVMSIRWSPPRSDGGVAISSYQYRVQIDTGPFGLPIAMPNNAMAT